MGDTLNSLHLVVLGALFVGAADADEIGALLGLDVDVSAFLPADTISNGFDNVADAQGFSPTLMEGYPVSYTHLTLPTSDLV